MRFITEVFGLPAITPFVDVRVDSDILVFVDPSSIRNDHSVLGANANSSLIRYFGRVVETRKHGTHGELLSCEAELRGMSEPSYTRLGYATNGSNGRAFGDLLGKQLWEQLEIPAVQEKALTKIEHLPLFLEGVGPDLVSDLCTRVLGRELIDFTQSMMREYPTLANGAQTHEIRVLPEGEHGWTTTDVLLPTVDGKPIVLVPRAWVTPKDMKMRSGQFFSRHTSVAEQEELTVLDRDGKLKKPTKKQIADSVTNVKRFNASRVVADLGAISHVADYEQWVDSEYEVTSVSCIRDVAEAEAA